MDRGFFGFAHEDGVEERQILEGGRPSARCVRSAQPQPGPFRQHVDDGGQLTGENGHVGGERGDHQDIRRTIRYGTREFRSG